MKERISFLTDVSLKPLRLLSLIFFIFSMWMIFHWFFGEFLIKVSEIVLIFSEKLDSISGQAVQLDPNEISFQHPKSLSFPITTRLQSKLNPLSSVDTHHHFTLVIIKFLIKNHDDWIQWTRTNNFNFIYFDNLSDVLLLGAFRSKFEFSTVRETDSTRVFGIFRIYTFQVSEILMPEIQNKLFLNSEGFNYPIFSRSLCMLAKIRNRPRSPDQEVDLGMCIICESSKKQVVIVPCGHICMCLKCMKKLKDSSRPRCPLCRGRILEYIYVYIWAFGSKLFH